jgi:CPA1 family monovalent cation:H+ antiporter
LEGESLVNDATALVALRFAAIAAATGTFSFGHASLQFVIVGLGGIAVGLVVGYMTYWIQKPIDDPPIEITLSLLTPFAAYLPAEHLGVSGVLAVVTTGLYHGWRIPEFTSSRTRLQAGPVWEMIEFLLNGSIFLLIGLQLPEVLKNLAGHSVAQLVWDATVLSIAAILIRIIWVFPATYLPRLLFRSLREKDPSPPWQHVTIVAWTGMRGVVSLAAALALPFNTAIGFPFPARDLIIFLTFVVILVTLVAQGLTLPPLIRWLGVKDDHRAEEEERIARLKANEAAVARLDEIASTAKNDPGILKRLRIEYEDRIRQLDLVSKTPEESQFGLFSSEYEMLSAETLKVERGIILQLRNEGVINDDVHRRIQRDIDLAEERLRRRR